jgi:putative membrane protein
MHGKQELIAAASSLILALPAFGQAGITSPDRGAHPMGSPATLGMLHRSNQYEIAMANLARDRSSNQAVKDYADLLISDHKKADDVLQSVATAHDIDLDHDLHAMQERHQEDMDAARSREVQSATGEYFRPMPRAGMGVSGMATEHEKAIDDLRKLKGPEFDRQFVKAMADDHRKVIDHLKTVRSNATDRDVTQLIDKLLPTLQKHETTARLLESS